MIRKIISILLVIIICISPITNITAEEQQEDKLDYVAELVSAINNMKTIDDCCPGKIGIANCVDAFFKCDDNKQLADVIINAFLINRFGKQSYQYEFYDEVNQSMQIVRNFSDIIINGTYKFKEYDFHNFKVNIGLENDINVTNNFYDVLNSANFNKIIENSNQMSFYDIQTCVERFDDLFGKLYLLSKKKINVFTLDTTTDKLIINDEKLNLYNNEVNQISETEKEVKEEINLEILKLAFNTFVDYYNITKSNNNKEAIMFLLNEYNLVQKGNSFQQNIQPDTQLSDEEYNISDSLDKIKLTLEDILENALVIKSDNEKEKVSNDLEKLVSELNNIVDKIKSREDSEKALSVINQILIDIVLVRNKDINVNVDLVEILYKTSKLINLLDNNYKEIVTDIIRNTYELTKSLELVYDDVTIDPVDLHYYTSYPKDLSLSMIKSNINKMVEIALQKAGIESISKSDILLDKGKAKIEINTPQLIEKAKKVRKLMEEFDQLLENKSLNNYTIKSKITVKIPEVESCNEIEVTLPEFKEIFNIVDKVKITTKLCNYIIDKKTFQDDILNKKLKFSIKQELETPITDINILIDSEEMVQFQEPIKIELPYNLTQSEDPLSIAVYKQNENNKKEIIGGKYNEFDNKVEFTTNNLGKYFVKKSLKTFDDIKDNKYKDEIEVIAGRGIIDGIDDKKFDPYGNVSVEEFYKTLMKVLELKSNFLNIELINKNGEKYISEKLQCFDIARKLDYCVRYNNVDLEDKISRYNLANIIKSLFTNNNSQFTNYFIPDNFCVKKGLKEEVHSYDEYLGEMLHKGDSYDPSPMQFLMRLDLMDLRANILFVCESKATRAEIAHVMYKLLEMINY